MSPGTFTPRQDKAFSFAESSIKHMTGLCTVIFSSSVLLSKFYIPTNNSGDVVILPFLVPWIILILSISFGVISMLQLTAVYAEKGGSGAPSIHDVRITKAVKWQVITFLLGLIGLMASSVLAAYLAA